MADASWARSVRDLRPHAEHASDEAPWGSSGVSTRAPSQRGDGVVHYAVTNMPGAVGRTSTYALTNATLPYLLEIADKGFERAAAANPAIRAGLNLVLGGVTNRAVAETSGMPCRET